MKKIISSEHKYEIIKLKIIILSILNIPPIISNY